MDRAYWEQKPWCYVGVPYDFGATTRSGQRWGPYAFRHVEGLADIEDHGDVYTVAEKNLRHDMLLTLKPLLKDWRIITIGGDDNINRFHMECYQDEQPILVHLDAHPDDQDEEPDESSHASWVKYVNEKGFTTATYTWYQGQRTLEPKFAETFEGPYDLEDIRNKKVYLAIDLDVVDPAFAPGVGSPEPAGPSSIEVMTLVEALSVECTIIAASITELTPDRDINGHTAMLARRLADTIVMSHD